MKKLDRIMTVIMSLTGVAFCGYVVWQIWARSAHPEIYAAQSGPWYTSIELVAIIAAAAMALEMVLYMALRRFAERTAQLREEVMEKQRQAQAQAQEQEQAPEEEEQP